MFEVVDYIVISQLQERLLFLYNNPHHMNYIFNGFCLPGVNNYLGHSYHRDATQYLLDNKLYVSPGYELDQSRKPALYVTYTTSESQQYLGDYGSSEQTIEVPAMSIYTFPIISSESYTLVVSGSLEINKRLWKGAVLKNHTFTAKVDTVFFDANKNCNIILDTVVPDDLSKTSWELFSDPEYKNCIIASSTDSVNVSLLLVTSGAVGNHKLYRGMVNYCLKALRPIFERYGLQVSSVNLSPIQAGDSNDVEFLSQFTLSGKFTTHWIDHEFSSPKSIGLCLELESTNPDNEIVEFKVSLK